MIHKDPLQLSQQELIDHVYELQEQKVNVADWRCECGYINQIPLSASYEPWFGVPSKRYCDSCKSITMQLPDLHAQFIEQRKNHLEFLGYWKDNTGQDLTIVDEIKPPVTEYLKRLRVLSKVKTNVHSNVSFIKLLDYAEALERKVKL